MSIDQIVSDFDGVTFHISTPESKSKILVSLQIRCFPDLLKYGAQQILEREYGQYVVAPEEGYNFSVQVDLDNLPEDPGLYMSVTLPYTQMLTMFASRGSPGSHPQYRPAEAQRHGCTIRARF